MLILRMHVNSELITPQGIGNTARLATEAILR